MVDLESARHWARRHQEKALRPGALAVDATMGNGGDTKALCQLVGETGHVYAFDVQRQALESTANLLGQSGLSSRASLFLLGHEHMAQVVPSGIDLVVFNLGWLPGSKDKRITTQTSTTISALSSALLLLKKGGLITVCVYPGHAEGANELAAVHSWAASLPRDQAQVIIQQYVNQPGSPSLFSIVKLKD